MNPKELRPGILAVGAIDWDRRLFDQLIPLPDGTSYNSYLVEGSTKTALIDTVDPSKTASLMQHLDEAHVKRLDYVVANHAEQDHSGTLPEILQRYPQATVLCTPRCKTIVMDLLHIPEHRIQPVADKETVSLGNRTLEFIHFPWVHWPETMLTYLREERILFPCDLFGSHLAISDMYATDEGRVYEAAKRYYAEIMMPFRASIQKDLSKLGDYAIDLIAPSHGPIYDSPQFILNAYRQWTNDEPSNLVVLPYISMHGSTRKMVDRFVDALAHRDLPVQVFDLATADIGKLGASLVDAATIIIGTPTVMVGAHPAVIYAAHLVNALRPKIRNLSIIGSYGWGSKAVEQLSGIVTTIKPEILPPVMVKGSPRGTDFELLDKLADTILEKHKGLAKLSHFKVS